MTQDPNTKRQFLPAGVMLNAYPDSIGKRLSDTLDLLRRPEFRNVFSLFYILPTFFHSDLDRGFSVIDYDMNEELVGPDDLVTLRELGIAIKFDLVLNHLSVRSPQFQDLLAHGEHSAYRDFFIDWDEFWKDHGEVGPDGYVVPDKQHLDKLFMRKPEMPVLRVRFPDGALKTYWNTFYQKIEFSEIDVTDFDDIDGMDPELAQALNEHVRLAIRDKGFLDGPDLDDFAEFRDDVIRKVCSKREYLGQMDLNARSDTVWAFYDETLGKLADYGASIIRLDAFAYLHKAPGETNFFNRPGTWDYLARLRGIAEKYGLTIFPEIHAKYGTRIHEEIAAEGYPVYDFFFPGLVIDALERGHNEALVRWIGEITERGLQTINMLGCHDGIPVLDLRGETVDGVYREGLLSDEHIDAAAQAIIDRGGLTKNLYRADGSKIDYYQINATFFSALGEEEAKLLLARAIQMFMPGVPQVWYLDLFAGTNDYAAAKRGRTASHKEINRTTLSLGDIEQCLQRDIVRDQLELIRLRNTSVAFCGEIDVHDTDPHHLKIRWRHPEATLTLDADLPDATFRIVDGEGKVVFASR